MDDANPELEAGIQPVYDHVRGSTSGLHLTPGSYTEIFTGSLSGLVVNSFNCGQSFLNRLLPVVLLRHHSSLLQSGVKSLAMVTDFRHYRTF